MGQQAVLHDARTHSLFGLSSLDRAELSAFGGQLASLVLFGPVLSFVIYRARRCCEPPGRSAREFGPSSTGSVEPEDDRIELLPLNRCARLTAVGRRPSKDDESE